MPSYAITLRVDPMDERHAELAHQAARNAVAMMPGVALIRSTIEEVEHESWDQLREMPDSAV